MEKFEKCITVLVLVSLAIYDSSCKSVSPLEDDVYDMVLKKYGTNCTLTRKTTPAERKVWRILHNDYLTVTEIFHPIRKTNERAIVSILNFSWKHPS